MKTVNCPYCGERREVMLPHEGQMVVLCGCCKRYYVVHADGEVQPLSVSPEFRGGEGEERP